MTPRYRKIKTDLGVVQSPLTKAWQGLSQQSQNLDPRRSVPSNKQKLTVPKRDTKIRSR